MKYSITCVLIIKVVTSFFFVFFVFIVFIISILIYMIFRIVVCRCIITKQK